MPLIKFIGSVLATILSVLVAVCAYGDDLDILFKTTPALEWIRPYADPVTLSLLVTDATGRPVSQGTVAIRLDAPRSRLFSTDFPWVEGTRLQEMQLNLRQGRLNWKYLFPIRGKYRLSVDASTPDGKKSSKEFTFTVHENQNKWWTLGAFSMFLFGIGVIAGRVFTGTRNRFVGIVVAVLILGAIAVSADEPSPGDNSDNTALEVQSATVGQPALIRWHAREGLESRTPAALFSIAIIQLEKHKTAFELERVLIASDFAMRFQFTDGAEYRLITAVERPGLPLRKNEKIITARALEPPIGAMLPALVFFIGLMAVGLVVGRWSKRGGPLEVEA